MYRLTLYYLIFLLIVAGGVSFFGVFSFTFVQLASSTLFLIAASWIFNKIFAYTFNVPANIESVYITALILALIITPPTSFSEFIFLFWAAALAMGSKFIFAISKKHIFNPAALAVFITSYTINQAASWWIGNQWIIPVALIGGFLIVRKIRRSNMVWAFLFITTLTTITIGLYQGTDLILSIKALLVFSSTIFFATIMLTEPLTTPPTNGLQIIYGAVVGIFFSPFMHLGTFYFTPEAALLAGNVFSYFVSPKQRLLLTFKEKIHIGNGLYDFVFKADKKLMFKPGQYLEWTVGHKSPDSRGNRRYFTISSSPTEDNIRMGVKFYEPSSTYKKSLLQLKKNSQIFAGQLAGDFTLPNNPNQPVVFIAGGIGITPFRSMIKYLIDKKEKRPIILFFSNRTAQEIIYTDVLMEAQTKLGIKTIYTLTDKTPIDWKGEYGRIDAKMLAKYLNNIQSPTYYVSGTHSMVTSMKDLLNSIGVPKKQIKTDFFPGFV